MTKRRHRPGHLEQVCVESDLVDDTPWGRSATIDGPSVVLLHRNEIEEAGPVREWPAARCGRTVAAKDPWAGPSSAGFRVGNDRLRDRRRPINETREEQKR